MLFCFELGEVNLNILHSFSFLCKKNSPQKPHDGGSVRGPAPQDRPYSFSCDPGAPSLSVLSFVSGYEEYKSSGPSPAPYLSWWGEV